MSFAETIYSGPIEEQVRDGIPLSIHPPTHQFDHYRDAMSAVFEARAQSLEPDDPLYFSAIQFTLPYSPAEWNPWLRAPKVIVLGMGGEMEVFTEGVYSPAQIVDQKKRSGVVVNQIFSTERFAADHLNFLKVPRKKMSRIYDVHTTATSPFLHRGDYPPYGFREYGVWGGSGDSYLYITSNIQEDRYKDSLEVRYEGDARDWKPYVVANLHRDRETGLWFYQKPAQRPQRIPFEAAA